jgi:hypothetical protein
MSKISPLRNAIGAIQPNKPRILPKEQTFAPPQTDYSQGNCTQGKPTQGNAPCDKQGDLPQGQDTQGNSTQGSLPQGELSQGHSPQGDLPPVSPNPETQFENIDVASYLSDRKRKRRQALTEGAVNLTSQLAPGVQEKLVKLHIADGWGRLAHCVTRQLKSPTRFGLKLVDVALILTVYDKTIAQVLPRMHAPITIKEFESETGMDASNIRAALRGLLSRSVLIKVSYKTLNFWALNHAYFGLQKRAHLPQGEPTQGQSTQGNAPCDKQGDLPQVEAGQTTPPLAASSEQDDSGFSSPKNLKKESKKESLSCEIEFPSDMRSRWETFEKVGKYSNSKKEREIFQELFVAYGEEFFKNCGKVVQFLEEHGNGKVGEEAKVYNPMVYLRGHWEHNLSRYQSYLQRQEALNAALAKNEESESRKKEQQIILEKEHEKGLQDQADQEARRQIDIQRLQQVYSKVTEFNSFVEKAVEKLQCGFTLNSWRKQGWDSPVVKSCVISYFLELEKSKQLKAGASSGSQAIA